MEHTHEFAVEKMCKALRVSRSGYYKWLKDKAARNNRKSELEGLVLYEYEKSRSTYGSPRINLVLNQQGHAFSKATIARCMKRLNIKARKKRKFQATTDSNHNYRISPNLLDRSFNVDIPGSVWVSDITYIRVQKHWLYLTVIIDLADRMVVGWSLSQDLSTNNTVIKAFYKALSYRVPEPEFIFHSDRGVQYACDDFVHLLQKYEARQSMSRKGNCWDNAVAESFFKTLKVECIYNHNINSNQMAYSLIFDYIQGWYNTVRIHSSLGGLSPLQSFIKKSNYLNAA
jgi:transposase InsO family protein